MNWFIKRRKVVTSNNFRGGRFFPEWPKPSSVLIAPTHEGMARLSGVDTEMVDPPKVDHQSQY